MLNKDLTRSVPIFTRSSSAHVEERAVSTGVENGFVQSFSSKIEDVKERLCCWMGQSPALRKVNFVYEDQPLAVKELELNKL